MIRKYLIVDDEHIAHDIIQKYCDMLPNMELAKNCYDAIEALDYLSDHAVDLIFLDLNMPKLKGFQFLKTLQNPPKVIVTTAYKEFALEGYELNIVDYLLKPFSFERFIKAINKAFIDQNSTSTSKQSNNRTEFSKENRIFLRSNKKHIQINANDILYVEASGNYVKIVLERETIKLRDTLNSILESLPSKGFLQVHRSFIVGLEHIKIIEANFIRIDQHAIPIGKQFKDNVKMIVL